MGTRLSDRKQVSGHNKKQAHTVPENPSFPIESCEAHACHSVSHYRAEARGFQVVDLGAVQHRSFLTWTWENPHTQSTRKLSTRTDVSFHPGEQNVNPYVRKQLLWYTFMIAHTWRVAGQGPVRKKKAHFVILQQKHTRIQLLRTVRPDFVPV